MSDQPPPWMPPGQPPPQGPQGPQGPPPGGGYGGPPPGGGYGGPPPGGGFGGPPPPGGGFGGPPQYGTPYGYGAAPPRNSGSAIAALILAIAAFVVCPLIPAIVALFLASSARKEIANSGGAVGGEGLVTAARIVAWINIGVSIAGILLFVVIFIIAAATSTSSSTELMGHAAVALA